MQAAEAAEAVLGTVGAKAVISQAVLPCRDAEILRLHHGAPVAQLAAERAIALPGTGHKVQLCLEAHLSAMAATLILFSHYSPPSLHQAGCLTNALSSSSARCAAGRLCRPATYLVNTGSDSRCFCIISQPM